MLGHPGICWDIVESAMTPWSLLGHRRICQENTGVCWDTLESAGTLYLTPLGSSATVVRKRRKMEATKIISAYFIFDRSVVDWDLRSHDLTSARAALLTTLWDLSKERR